MHLYDIPFVFTIISLFMDASRTWSRCMFWGLIVRCRSCLCFEGRVSHTWSFLQGCVFCVRSLLHDQVTFCFSSSVWLRELAPFHYFLSYLTEASSDAPDITPLFSPCQCLRTHLSSPCLSLHPFLPDRIRKLLSVGDRNEERTAERWHWSVFSPAQLHQPSGTLPKTFSQKGASSLCNLSQPFLLLYLHVCPIQTFCLFPFCFSVLTFCLIFSTH